MGYSNNEEVYEIVIDVLPEQYINNNIDDNLNDIEREENRDNDIIQEARIVNYRYYIGIPIYSDYNILLGCHVNPKTLFKYTNQMICSYLFDWASTQLAYLRYGSPEIMQLQITYKRLNTGQTYGIYNVVLKTFWLRIVQKKWRKVYAERKSKLHVLEIMSYMNLIGQHQINVCKNSSLMPRLKGMLYAIKRQ